MKGYLTWDYWNHRVIAQTPVYGEACDKLIAAIAANKDIGENWFGIEAVEDINAVPRHLVCIS